MPTILLTGSNRGLGLEIAKRYLELDWNIIATCRNPEGAKELQALGNDFADNLTIEALDVADFTAVDELAAKLTGTAIDILFNNAGVSGKWGSFGSVDYDHWGKVFRVNTMSTLKLAEAFVDNVASSEKKLFAAMSSLMGSIADNSSGGSYIYRSSKTALNSVLKSLSIDLAEKGIGVVALHPGWVRTDMGGEQAPLSIEESVAGLLKVLEQESSALSGKFLNYAGDELDW